MLARLTPTVCGTRQRLLGEPSLCCRKNWNVRKAIRSRGTPDSTRRTRLTSLHQSSTYTLPPSLYHYPTPWSTVGYLTYKRTYSRRLSTTTDSPTSTTTEEWPDTVSRVVNACRNQLNVGFDENEEHRLAEYMLSLKGTVAGRFLWQLGTETVNKLGLLSLQNCAFTTIDEPVRPFTWAMDCLMLGSGVGVNLQREYVYKLPPVSDSYRGPSRLDDASADFIVPDTREGWVELLGRTLESAFGSRKPGFSYSTQLIRGKGAPIKSFGGVASGP